jgi:23S rRNA pseudouridine2604 synthase
MSRPRRPPGEKERGRGNAAEAGGDELRVRLNKRLSELGLCSRREADRYIERGQVLVDGEIVGELGVRVLRSQRIELTQAARTSQQGKLTVLLHKPVGWVSAQAEAGYRPAIELVTAKNLDPRLSWTPWRGAPPRDWIRGMAPAGRLDIDSSGLLVLTQDGVIAKRLIGDRSDVEKEYLVRYEGPIDETVIARLRHGLWLDGQALRPARVEAINDRQLRFVLRQGRKRQIRRMCTLVGLKVTGLKRVRIGGVMLAGLARGRWRFLRDKERF